MQYTIQGQLPDLNEIIAASKAHYGNYSSLKKIATLKCSTACRNLPVITKGVYFDITYYCKNKRKDPDNISVAKKFIFDGLIKAGKIKNDGWNDVLGWNEKFKVDKENERIEVTIRDYE